MAELEAVIGLEIHVQLATKTKMFCGCELSFGDEPNVHTCPVCLAHPGVLPVPNEQAILYALQIAAALECEVAPHSIFHRKNYFYPDSPKAYQISQFDIPLASNGKLGDVRIHRAHLEEDAAKMIHVGESGRIHGSGASLVDFNRGGTPLVEIVTEPDLRSAAEAAQWARLLRETVRQLGVSDVNMEEGSLRVDANVSVRPAGSEVLGTKTELKNMNSFRFLQRGVEAELERQRELIGAGGTVTQETLHFDPRAAASPRCARRRSPTTTATSPSPTWCRWRRPSRCCARLARRCRSCRRRGSSATWGWAWPRTWRRRWPPTPGPPLTSSRSRGIQRDRAQGGRQLGHRRARRGAAPGDEEVSAAESKVAPDALAALVDAGPGEEDLPRQRQDRAGGTGRRGRRARPRSSSARASPRSPTAASWSRSSPPRSRPTPRRPSRSAKATARRSAPSSAP